jgi:hypothetical protein
MPEHSVRVIERLQERGTPLQMYFHQGGHGGAPPLEMMNRWFTRYVLGVENGVEDDPRAWIVREQRRPPRAHRLRRLARPRLGAGHPPTRPGGEGVGRSGSRATRRGSGRGRRSHRGGGGAGDLVDDVAFSGAELAQAGRSPNRLLYATAELTAPVHISGTPEVTIRLALDRPPPTCRSGSWPSPGRRRRRGSPTSASSPGGGPTRRTTGPSPRACPWSPASSGRDLHPPAHRPGDPRRPPHRPHDLLQRPRVHPLARARRRPLRRGPDPGGPLDEPGTRRAASAGSWACSRSRPRCWPPGPSSASSSGWTSSARRQLTETLAFAFAASALLVLTVGFLETAGPRGPLGLVDLGGDGGVVARGLAR